MFEIESDGATITLLQKNGLTVKILPKGEILQSLTSQLTNERAQGIYNLIGRDIKKKYLKSADLLQAKEQLLNSCKMTLFSF